MSPLASFVIPVYNSVEWLPHSIESCQKQTIKDIEIIIVDDGSTDSICLSSFRNWLEKDKRIHYFKLDHCGRSRARNFGNLTAAGKYIFVLDADDYCAPNRVELTLKKLKNADLVYGSAQCMDLFGNKGSLLVADVFDLNKAEEKLTNGIVHSTVAYTKELANKFKYSELPEISDNGIDDWDFILKVARAGIKIDFIPEVLVAYRILSGSISHSRDEQKVLEIKKKLLKEPVLA